MANRTLGENNGKINEVTRGGACHACKSKDHGHTKEDRLQRCPYRNKPCPKCKVKGHLPVSYMCRKKVPQSGKVKEVKEEVPLLERTPSSAGEVGLVTHRGEETSSKVFQITASVRGS